MRKLIAFVLFIIAVIPSYSQEFIPPEQVAGNVVDDIKLDGVINELSLNK